MRGPFLLAPRRCAGKCAPDPRGLAPVSSGGALRRAAAADSPGRSPRRHRL